MNYKEYQQLNDEIISYEEEMMTLTKKKRDLDEQYQQMRADYVKDINNVMVQIQEYKLEIAKRRRSCKISMIIKKTRRKSVTPAQKQSMIYNKGGICKKCNYAPATIVAHIVPLSQGGIDAETNYTIHCAECEAKEHRVQ